MSFKKTYSLHWVRKDTSLVGEMLCAAIKFENSKIEAHTILSMALQFEGKDTVSARARLLDIIQKDFMKMPEISDVIRSSAAGKISYQMLDEFLKNSLDANATEITVNYSVENGQVVIRIEDDGNIEIPLNKLGCYDWRQALLQGSEKKNSSQMGGQHLGLAIIAYSLEIYGKGKLFLDRQQPADKKGAVVTLTSSAIDCGDIDVKPQGQGNGVDLKYEMICAFIAEQPLAEQASFTKDMQKIHPDYPTDYISMQARQARLIPSAEPDVVVKSLQQTMAGKAAEKRAKAAAARNRDNAAGLSLFSPATSVDSSSTVGSPFTVFSPASNGAVSSDALGASSTAASPF